MNRFIFNEQSLKEKLLELNAPERLKLDEEGFIKSAILFLIRAKKNKPYDLILIRRTKSDEDKHSGEMCFPGGKYDDSDLNLQETALRECEEELGIPREKITILGCFDDHITPKQFIITPVVGFIDENQEMKRQEKEVSEIIPIPLDFFANKRKYREKTFLLDKDTVAVGKYTYKTPIGKKYVIFGATSHLIVHFLEKMYDLVLMQPGARRLTPRYLKQKNQY